jgi:hypothetical protein
VIVPKNPNIRYESYDFIGIRATEGVFGIHKYPALTHLGKISNKRMPLKNSPTNVKGKTDRTMGEEYIVIMRKLYG